MSEANRKTMDLKKLREISEEAKRFAVKNEATGCYDSNWDTYKLDEDYINAFDPDTIIELLDYVEHLEDELLWRSNDTLEKNASFEKHKEKLRKFLEKSRAER